MSPSWKFFVFFGYTKSLRTALILTLTVWLGSLKDLPYAKVLIPTVSPSTIIPVTLEHPKNCVKFFEV